MGMGFPWESNGKCPMEWDGTARIAFPMGPIGQKLKSRKLKIC